MRNSLEPESMTPAQRLEEVVGLLATGFLRLRLRRTDGGREKACPHAVGCKSWPTRPVGFSASGCWKYQTIQPEQLPTVPRPTTAQASATWSGPLDISRPMGNTLTSKNRRESCE